MRPAPATLTGSTIARINRWYLEGRTRCRNLRLAAHLISTSGRMHGDEDDDGEYTLPRDRTLAKKMGIAAPHFSAFRLYGVLRGAWTTDLVAQHFDIDPDDVLWPEEDALHIAGLQEAMSRCLHRRVDIASRYRSPGQRLQGGLLGMALVPTPAEVLLTALLTESTEWTGAWENCRRENADTDPLLIGLSQQISGAVRTELGLADGRPQSPTSLQQILKYWGPPYRECRQALDRLGNGDLPLPVVEAVDRVSVLEEVPPSAAGEDEDGDAPRRVWTPKVCPVCRSLSEWGTWQCGCGADLRIRSVAAVRPEEIADDLPGLLEERVRRNWSRHREAGWRLEWHGSDSAMSRDFRTHLMMLDQQAFEDAGAAYGTDLSVMASKWPKSVPVLFRDNRAAAFLDFFLLEGGALEPGGTELSDKLHAGELPEAADILECPGIISPDDPQHEVVDVYTDAFAASPRNRQQSGGVMLSALGALIREDPVLSRKRVRRVLTVAISNGLAPQERVIGSQKLRIEYGDLWATSAFMQPLPLRWYCRLPEPDELDARLTTARERAEFEDIERFDAGELSTLDFLVSCRLADRYTVYSVEFDEPYPLLADVAALPATRIMTPVQPRLTPEDAARLFTDMCQ